MNWRLVEKKEFNDILKFLENNNNIINPPISAYPDGIKGSLELFFKKGEVCVLEKENVFYGFVAYLLGDPNENYKDKSVAYVYLMFLTKDSSKIYFAKCLSFLLKRFSMYSINLVRFKSYLTHNYNNSLYDKFAKRVKLTKNTQGEDTILYEVKIPDIIMKLKK